MMYSAGGGAAGGMGAPPQYRRTMSQGTVPPNMQPG